MKKFYTLSLCLLVLAAISCSGSKGPSATLISMKDCQVSGGTDCAKKYFTNGTMAVLDEINKLRPETQKNPDNAGYAEKSKWDVIDEKIDGDTATVKIKFTEHPIENMKGFELEYRMKKEEGEWRIDQEKEMRTALEMMKLSKKSGGLNLDMLNKMKDYLKK